MICDPPAWSEETTKPLGPAVMDENSGGVSSWNCACFHVPDWVMCQIMPLSPVLLVTLPTAMMPPWPSGTACWTTGRPMTPPLGVNPEESASRDQRLPSGELKIEVPVGPVAKRRKRSFEVVIGPSVKSLLTSAIIGVLPVCRARA